MTSSMGWGWGGGAHHFHLSNVNYFHQNVLTKATTYSQIGTGRFLGNV